MNPFEQNLSRYLTAEQLAQIQQKHIAIGGAGGLGSNICVLLIRCGFKHLEILDHDIVDASNLNRQDFTLADVGQPKVEALRRRLWAINPDAQIIVHHDKWTTGNAETYFNRADFIVEAFDLPEVKASFVEYYLKRASFLVSGNGMAGIYHTSSANTVRQVGNLYIVGDESSSTDKEPPLAPRVIQCAAKMAEIVLGLTLKSIPA